MKVKATDTGKFVTVYTEGEGKSDAVLLEVVDDIAEVWYPHLQNSAGGVGERVMIESRSVVALGPLVAVNVPLF